VTFFVQFIKGSLQAFGDGGSDFEDLDSPSVLRRESDAGRRLCCIEHDCAQGFELRTRTGTEDKSEEIGVEVRSSGPPRRAVREWR
jgi:hypothetical protein